MPLLNGNVQTKVRRKRAEGDLAELKVVSTTVAGTHAVNHSEEAVGLAVTASCWRSSRAEAPGRKGGMVAVERAGTSSLCSSARTAVLR